MKLSEAYQELELPQGTSSEDAKKQYRKLVAKWHPDQNKDPSAEDKIKKINEAYNCIKDGKGNDRESNFGQGSWNPFHRQQVIQLEHIEVSLSINFKDAILGCKRDLKYSRQAKCVKCEGAGEMKLDNGCKRCQGKGQITHNNRGMIFVSTCPECQGRSNTQECTICSGEGTIKADVTINVSVPAGITNNATLRLQSMGNYAGSVMGLMDQYTDAFCHVAVAPEEGLSLSGKDVISTAQISLLEALKGCTKTTKTIFGQKEIVIPQMSKHKEEVIIPHHGVEGTGSQRVILEVSYPNDVSAILTALEN